MQQTSPRSRPTGSYRLTSLTALPGLLPRTCLILRAQPTSLLRGTVHEPVDFVD